MGKHKKWTLEQKNKNSKRIQKWCHNFLLKQQIWNIWYGYCK